MTGSRARRVALTAVAVLAGLWPALLRAQSAVSVLGPGEDTLRQVAPRFVIRATGFPPSARPIVLRLEVSASSMFTAPLLADTSVTGDSATIGLGRALPHGVTLFWRAIARGANGVQVVSPVVGPRTSALWVVLLRPNSVAGDVVSSRPTFLWRGAEVVEPLAPWSYRLVVQNPASGATLTFGPLADSAFSLPTALEANTAYRWSVVARLANGDSATAHSRASFVVASDDTPPLTLLYQNFPNPFPSVTSLVTCVWFDLHVASAVRLDVYDLRGGHVRSLHPAGGAAVRLPAGRYGRSVGGGICDERFAWDGRSDTGAIVPPGVYLLRLRAGQTNSVKRMLFRGR